MTYTGRTRRIRIERAARRFEMPPWRLFIHPVLVMAAMAKARYPDARYLVLPDDRKN